MAADCDGCYQTRSNIGIATIWAPYHGAPGKATLHCSTFTQLEKGPTCTVTGTTLFSHSQGKPSFSTLPVLEEGVGAAAAAIDNCTSRTAAE